MLLECCRLPVERHRSLIHFDALIRLGCFSCNRTVLIKYIAHAQVPPRCMKPPQRAGKVSIFKDIFALNIQVSLFFYALAWQNSLVIDLENISSVSELSCLVIYFWDTWHGRARPPRHATQFSLLSAQTSGRHCWGLSCGIALPGF